MHIPLKVIQLHKNEEKLIEKALKNNRIAQNALYEMHASKMLSVCRYYVKDLHHAEDIMIKGFFKAFTNLKQYNKSGKFEGWLRQIMVREAISFLRQKKELRFIDEEIVEDSNSVESFNSKLGVEELQSLIDSLPVGYKVVFNMNVLEGYKHTEIAKMLKISVGTSKSQLYKAKKVLQQKIKEQNKTSYGTL